MRIAMVSEHASPLATLGSADAGGQNVHVAALSRALAADGHEVVVYTRRYDPEQPEQDSLCPGVSVVHVPAGPPQLISKDDLLNHMPEMGHHLRELWRTDQPDVVHSHFWMSALAALIGLGGQRIPLVHTFHALGRVKRRHQGSNDTSPPQRIQLEKGVCRAADHIIAMSTDEVHELVAMGTVRSKIAVVPCGVDLEMFHPDGPITPRTDRPRLLSVGRLVERKGFDTAIVALRQIPDVELVIAGGPPADQLTKDPEAARLAELARRFRVADRVRLLGAVRQEQMPALIRSADIVLCTPRYEQFGIVPLEAMACGRPVLATAVGGLTDSVIDGANGLLVPPGRPSELAKSVRRLLRDRTILEGLGVAGRVRAQVHYPWSRIASETGTIYAALQTSTNPAEVVG